MTLSAEWLTRATVWLALACYLAGPIAALMGRDHGPWQRRARGLYTAGLVAFLFHVLLAFHVFYGWSHSVALAETARETAAVTGHDTDAGLYVNYVFLALWLLDVVWWWRAGWSRFRKRPAGVDLALHGFFVFIAFNATVVFETGPVRWFGASGLVLLAIVAWRARQRLNGARSPSRSSR